MQEDIYQEIEKLVRQHPNKAIELFEDWADKMPEEAKESIENKLYGASIRTKEKMDEAIKLAEMGITTDGKKYTCYDINFVAVLKYLIHNNTLNPLGANPKTYIKMALDELMLDSEYAYDHYEELYDRYN